MERRTFIGSIGVLTGLSTAGCLGKGGNGNNSSNNSSMGSGKTKTEEPQLDTPDFEEYVNEDAPDRALLLAAEILTDELQYGDQFKAKVAVANTGGAPLKRNLSVRLRTDTSGKKEVLESSIVVDELKSKKVEWFTVGPFEPAYAGEWELEAGSEFYDTHSEFEAVARVEAKSGDIGETIEFPDGLRLTPTDPQVCQSLHYNDRESMGFASTWIADKVQKSLQDQVLLVNRFTLGNGGTEIIEFDADSFYDGPSYDLTNVSSTVGKRLTQLGGGKQLSSATLTGSPLEEINLEPGDSVEAWTITQVDIEELEDAGLNVFFETTSDLPEIRLDYGLDEDSVPEFELKETVIPDQRRDEEQELEFVVENVGGLAGTFYGAVQVEDDYSDEWKFLPEGLEATIEPGETQRVRTTVDPDPDDDEAPYTFRVVPFGEEFEL